MKLFSMLAVLLFVACSNLQEPEESGFCLSQPDDTYDLMETYFSKDQHLTHEVIFHYFTNGKEDALTEDYFVNRLKLADGYFDDSHRTFEVKDVIYYDQSPTHYNNIRKSIESVEGLKGNKREDLRKAFHIVHHSWWAYVLNKEGYINIYIYDNLTDGYAGVAGGIGSVFCSLQRSYLDPRNKTLEHELGHCLGLLHTHQSDKTNGLNNHSGDKVCDTPTTQEDLVFFMSQECNYNGDKFKNISVECQENVLKNIMSYNIKSCREKFTQEQHRRMQKILEGSSDLRKTVKELKMVSDFHIPEEVEII